MRRDGAVLRVLRLPSHLDRLELVMGREDGYGLLNPAEPLLIGYMLGVCLKHSVKINRLKTTNFIWELGNYFITEDPKHKESFEATPQ
jgi:hypothetical protein